MASAEKQKSTVDTFCENIVNFSVDREDIKEVVCTIPQDQGINTVTLEYELQLLKIISVGWSLSLHMDGHDKKAEVSEKFWFMIREFSKNLSEMTNLTSGAEIDYFQMLKDRLTLYLKSLEHAKKNTEPASAIGPEFATQCKDNDNPFLVLTGARLFSMTTHAVKEYLDSVILEAPEN